MIDLHLEIKRELAQLDPPDLWDRIRADADVAGDTDVVDLAAARHRRSRLWLAAAAAIVLLALVGALTLLDRDQAVDTGPVNEVPGPVDAPLRSGALRTGGAVHNLDGNGGWDDPVDSTEPWVDLVRVGGEWSFDLVETPPAGGLGAETVLAYGVVLDSDGDGVADYEVGVDDGGPDGVMRAWLTNLDTGERTEKVGPPYGNPVDFSHPSEDGGNPSLSFLSPNIPGAQAGGTKYRDGSGGPAANTVRYYAWASVTRDGEVTARDYAPDTGWIALESP